MRVALYDRLALDDLHAYRQVADITLCSRFRPHTKVAPDADLILQTWTRAPDTGQPVVSLCGGCRRHIGHFHRSPVYAAPSWQHHDVVHAAVTAVLTYGDRHRPVAVVGMGRVGSRVARQLRRCGWRVRPIHHENRYSLAGAGTISLHLADSKDADGWLGSQLGAMPNVAAVVNFARPDQVDHFWMDNALAVGTVGTHVVDGGKPWDRSYRRSKVIYTPRTGWDGHRSPVLRPRSVLTVLRAAAEGRLDQLRQLKAPDLVLDL